MGELGRGGRTVTYRVRRHSSVYAMKILRQRGGDELAFRREAALLASVNDPGLVQVHEVGVADGQPYLIMDFVDGPPLTSVLGQGRPSVAQIVALETARAAQLEVAVAAANRQRDLAETLRDALAEITGTLQPEPESVLLRLRRTVVGSVGADRAFLVLGQPDDGAVRIHTSDTEQPSQVEPGPVLSQLLTASTTVVGTSATGRPELLADVESCWLAIPLLARGDHLGLLLLASRDEHAYDDGRADLATALVGQAMVAYERSEEHTSELQSQFHLVCRL